MRIIANMYNVNGLMSCRPSLSLLPTTFLPFFIVNYCFHFMNHQQWLFSVVVIALSLLAANGLPIRCPSTSCITIQHTNEWAYALCNVHCIDQHFSHIARTWVNCVCVPGCPEWRRQRDERAYDDFCLGDVTCQFI